MSALTFIVAPDKTLEGRFEASQAVLALPIGDESSEVAGIFTIGRAMLEPLPTMASGPIVGADGLVRAPSEHSNGIPDPHAFRGLWRRAANTHEQLANKLSEQRRAEQIQHALRQRANQPSMIRTIDPPSEQELARQRNERLKRQGNDASSFRSQIAVIGEERTSIRIAPGQRAPIC